MAASDDEETIARFILRARRVEAHSLMRDREALARHEQGSSDVHLDVSGAVSVTRKLPEDEEAFESLAARVRPLMLNSESIHHAKVFAALEQLVERSPAATVEHMATIGKLRGAWQAVELQGSQIQAYAVQSMRLDGTDATPMVSDTQLAAGWLYADLVHADARGPKQEALRLPLRERYAAGVRIFSRIATLTVSTLRLVEDLRSAGAISIPTQAWDLDVVVGAAELVEEGTLLVAPPEAEMPDLREARLGLTDDWKRFTVTDLLRQDLANHVYVVLSRPDGSLVADYEAAVERRRADGDVLRWHVLVAGSVMFSFEFTIENDDAVRPSAVHWETFNSTNRLLLASHLLMLQMHEAQTMVFRGRRSAVRCAQSADS